MLFTELLVSAFLAIMVGTVFFYGLRRRGPWGSFWAFFSILLLAGIIAEAWTTPIGPPVFGVSWVGSLIFILFFALLIAAATPTHRQYGKSASEMEAEEVARKNPGAVAVGAFFWFLLVIMTVVAIAGLFYTPVA